MIVGPISIRIAFEKTAIAASVASIAAALDVLPQGVADGFREQFIALTESGDLFGGEAIGLAAGGAGELKCFEILPSDRYVELVAALAGAADAHPVRFTHGWPVLSVVESSAIVAEAGGDENASGGGAA